MPRRGKPINQKREEAAARQAAYDALTPQERLARAIERGHENSREAKRLRSRMPAK